MLNLGHEKRRVRFASIMGIDRTDLPLAAEVWQSDLNNQIWVSRDTIKLGCLFTQYMSDPNERHLSLGYLERTYLMDAGMVRDVLRQMKMYGAIHAFTIEDGVVRVSLRLTITQRLKVLEMRNKFLSQSGLSSMRELLDGEEADQWAPKPKAQEAVLDDGKEPMAEELEQVA